MVVELQALENNNTWDVVELPQGHKPIQYKWMYKLKTKADGTIEKYKARLVAMGYNQIEGVDYFESFSPMAKTVTMRIILALAITKQWQLHQMDINNAFLHGYLNDEIYMKAPEG
ncbi:transmembrane signal receptor [Lithospermum erythrorhizon]|uniref:Transmembrane signal receptor n=1 Tax=Lithospermum erythrorhizon TaxID=34254 RepID=A0AAV3QR75_LITER